VRDLFAHGDRRERSQVESPALNMNRGVGDAGVVAPFPKLSVRIEISLRVEAKAVGGAARIVVPEFPHLVAREEASAHFTDARTSSERRGCNQSTPISDAAHKESWTTLHKDQRIMMLSRAALVRQ
jgi:hypothetical protein